MNGKARPHWSFWLLGVAALAWNAMGCVNYLMQMDPERLAAYPEAARALVADRPAWATAAFAVGVFGGAAGCVLLLLRTRFAWHLFAASLLGVAVADFQTARYGASGEIWAGSLSSLIVAVIMVWYSGLARRRGWIG
jgi:hypothetical protein